MVNANKCHWCKAVSGLTILLLEVHPSVFLTLLPSCMLWLGSSTLAASLALPMKSKMHRIPQPPCGIRRIAFGLGDLGPYRAASMQKHGACSGNLSWDVTNDGSIFHHSYCKRILHVNRVHFGMEVLRLLWHPKHLCMHGSLSPLLPRWCTHILILSALAAIFLDKYVDSWNIWTNNLVKIGIANIYFEDFFKDLWIFLSAKIFFYMVRVSAWLYHAASVCTVHYVWRECCNDVIGAVGSHF